MTPQNEPLKGAGNSQVSDREFVITRLLDAPRELVFEVWTDPEHVAHWWGPNGFTTTTDEMNVKPGGFWRFAMHAPDGMEYPNRIEFLEVVENERLVYTHDSGVANDPGRFHVTVTFEEEDKKTRLTMRALFESAEIFDKLVKEFGIIEGGQQTVDRLEAYLNLTME